MSGFSDSTVFKTINDTDIDSIEKFMREDLWALWQTNSIRLPYGSTIEDAFGKIFKLNPSRFKFLPGDRKFIRMLVEIHANDLKTDTKSQLVQTQKPKSDSIPTVTDSTQRTLYFLNRLHSTAEINLKRKKEGFRFDEEMKLFAAYLRMLCGPLAYNTIHRNLEGAVPSLVSTNRYIKASNCDVLEGALRCEELLKYLEDRR